MSTQIRELRDRLIAEQATGCRGAGDYSRWAREQGYPHCETYDWSSSAGDWTFIVSEDGVCWYPMFQTNNYPNPGFTRTIDFNQDFYGTSEEVLKEINEAWG